MPSTSQGVSQSKSKVSSRKRMAPAMFNWETESMSVAKSFGWQLTWRMSVTNLPKEKTWEAKGWACEWAYYNTLYRALIIFSHLHYYFLSSLHTHHSWKSQSEMIKFCNSQGKILMDQKLKCMLVYAAEEKPWRTEISMRILSHLP